MFRVRALLGLAGIPVSASVAALDDVAVGNMGETRWKGSTRW